METEIIVSLGAGLRAHIDPDTATIHFSNYNIVHSISFLDFHQLEAILEALKKI